VRLIAGMTVVGAVTVDVAEPEKAWPLGLIQYA
jgi:hypothetical protein